MRKNYDFREGKKGAVIPSPRKTRITIMIDDDILAYFRTEADAKGMGYQTRINAALRTAIDGAKGRSKEDEPLTVAKLRKVLREELRA